MTELRILSHTASIANHFLAELRNVDVQQDSLRFRRNLERLGEIFAYEISKTLPYEKQEITTPLGQVETLLLPKAPVLLTILRAGLPFHHGFLSYFDHARSGFVGAYREEGEGELKIHTGYVAAPSLVGETVILADPMLATGQSMVEALELIVKAHGEPANLHLVSAVASPEGIAYVQENLRFEATLWVGAKDQGLDEHAYIVPGLGDAGDLSFGDKL